MWGVAVKAGLRLNGCLGLALVAAWSWCGLAVFAQPGPAAASVGPKLWLADNGQEHALLGGLDFSARLPLQLECVGEFLQGAYHNEGDREAHQHFRGGVQRVFSMGAVGAGFSYQAISTELKPGWVWDDDHPEESERNADIYGPYLSGVLKGWMGSTPFGWSFSGLWMFRDFGELDSLGYDGSYFSVEGSLFAEWKKIRLAAGYRYERYRDLPSRSSQGVRTDRNVVRGLFLAAGVLF